MTLEPKATYILLKRGSEDICLLEEINWLFERSTLTDESFQNECPLLHLLVEGLTRETTK